MKDLDGSQARDALRDPTVEALEVGDLADRAQRYVRLGQRVVRWPPFMLDLGGRWSDIAAQLHSTLRYACTNRGDVGLLAELLEDVRQVLGWACELSGGSRTLLSLRNFFAPGDLVWHVDRSRRTAAFRVLWTVGRLAGMHVTHRDSIDPLRYRAWMRREHPLLCRLDRVIYEQRTNLATAWCHRPRQVSAMQGGHYPFVLDPSAAQMLAPNALTVHRMETPGEHGTWHRSDFGNEAAPGMQFVMTVTT